VIGMSGVVIFSLMAKFASFGAVRSSTRRALSAPFAFGSSNGIVALLALANSVR
jgi:hypothetical protein